jgi:hypothetical protein
MRLKTTCPACSATKCGGKKARPKFPMRICYPPLPGPLDALIGNHAPLRVVVCYQQFITSSQFSLIFLFLASHPTRALSVLPRAMSSASLLNGVGTPCAYCQCAKQGACTFTQLSETRARMRDGLVPFVAGSQSGWSLFI